MSKELEALELISAFLEGAIEQQEEILHERRVLKFFGGYPFDEGKLEALNQTLEEVKLIKANFKSDTN